MSESTPVLTTFLLSFGVLTQGALVLRETRQIFYMTCLAGGIFLLAGFMANEGGYDLKVHLAGFLLLFCFAFPFFFIDQMMPRVSEHSLLQYTLIFLFVLQSSIGDIDLLFSPTLVLCVGIPSGLVLLTCLFPFHLKSSWKIVAYIWYLIVTVFLLLFEVFSYGLWDIVERGVGSLEAAVNVFLTGMVLLFLSANVSYLALFIPIPREDQTFQERMSELRDYCNRIVARFSDKQVSLVATASILLVYGGLFYSNLRWHVIDDWLLVHALTVGLAQFFYLRGDS